MTINTDRKPRNIVFGEENYPDLLTKLSDPPKLIYYKGELDKSILETSIAIVGSRRMTRYGREVVDKFVSGFVAHGVTIISGFMYGVDSEVHERTVEYGGRTIAVFGSGINQIYPPENKKLYSKILQNRGCILSEYSPTMKPKLWSFARRNRIIAALATLGVLVIEAAEKSGSLITVDYAKKLGKPVYAVPGSILSSVSKGTNLLVKKGIANLVDDPSDIIKIAKKETPRKSNNFSALENRIIKSLENVELTPDEVALVVGEGVIEVGTALSLLVLNGVIAEVQGKYYLTRGV